MLLYSFKAIITCNISFKISWFSQDDASRHDRPVMQRTPSSSCFCWQCLFQEIVIALFSGFVWHCLILIASDCFIHALCGTDYSRPVFPISFKFTWLCLFLPRLTALFQICVAVPILPEYEHFILASFDLFILQLCVTALFSSIVLQCLL